MSEPVRIKITPDDKMVEIDLRQKHHYENRVELDLMLKTHTMASDEDDSALLAEEVVHQLVEILKEKFAGADHPYGVEILNWGVCVHDTDIAEEEE